MIAAAGGALPGFTTERFPSAAPVDAILREITARPRDLDAYRRLFALLRRDLVRVATFPLPAGGRSAFPDSVERAYRFFRLKLSASSAEPRFLFGLGVTEKLRGDYASAVHQLETSILRGADFWDVFEELIPYYRSASELSRISEVLKAGLDGAPNAALLHQGLGYIDFWTDDYGPAGERLEKALALHEAAGDSGARIRCLYLLAYLQMYLNRYDEAVRSIEQSIAAARKARDLRSEILGEELLSFIRIDQGETRGALELCGSAYARAGKFDDPYLEAVCRLTLGVARMESGDLAAAESDLESCRRYYELLGEHRRLGIVQYWLSILYRNKGDFSRALDVSRQGLRIAQRLGFRTGEVFHLAAIGDFYHSLGQVERSLSYNKKALLMSQRYIGKWSREECLNSIGAVCMETGRYGEALEHFKLALSYVRQISHNREEARCLYNIGLAYFELGDRARALEYFERSRRQAEHSGKRVDLGLALNRLGDLALQAGPVSDALAHYRAALSIGLQTGHPALRWQAYAGLAGLAVLDDRPGEAADLFRRAAAIIEDQRSWILEREQSAGFFKSGLGVYENLVNLYFGMHIVTPGRGFDEECFTWAEKARSRAFLDDLHAARIDPRTFFGSPRDRREILSLSGSISRLLTELGRSDLDRTSRDVLWEQLEREEENLQSAVEAVRQDRPGLSRLLRADPSRPAEIREKLLDPETALVEFMAGKENLFIFYLTREKLAIHRYPADETRALLELARNYAGLIASPRLRGRDCAAAGQRLYERLLLPGEAVLSPKIRRLIVIPDLDLCYVPFETLVRGTRGGPEESRAPRFPDYLVHSLSITYAPSASSLVDILDRGRRETDHPGRKDLLAVGDPVYGRGSARSPGAEAEPAFEEYSLRMRFAFGPLPFTRKEVLSLRRFVRPGGAEILLGEDASEENLKRQPLVDYRILHFATHSLLDERVASRSSLVLAQDDDPREDGFLQVREIYDREIDADLVVLSACRTGRGKLERGESVQGLAQAFLCAGAKSTVVSLWPVGDREASRFMEAFYRRLSRGETKEEALRRAKLELLGSDDPSPRGWAGFVLIGEGDRPVPLHPPPARQGPGSRPR